MKAENHIFLRQLARFPANTFERKFVSRLRRYGLGGVLDQDALCLLYEATFHATLCNIAFNGLGGCGGRIRPDRESFRMTLERDFMRVRARLYASRAYQALPKSKAEEVERAFLTVRVENRNLAR